MPRHTYKYITSASGLPRIAQELSESECAALDLETEGFDPYQGRIRLLSLNILSPTNENQVYVIDLFQTRTLEPLCRALNVYRGVICFQNGKFDQKWLWHHHKVRIYAFFDTFRASSILYNGLRGPDDKLYGHNLYDILLRELKQLPIAPDLGGSNWSAPVLTEDQLDYAAEDVIFLPKLRTVLKEKIHKLGLDDTARLEFGAIFPEARMELAGFPFDKERWLRLAEGVRAWERGLRVDCLNLLPNPKAQQVLFSPEQLEAPLLPIDWDAYAEDAEAEEVDIIEKLTRKKPKASATAHFNVESSEQVLASLQQMGLQVKRWDPKLRLEIEEKIGDTSELVLAQLAATTPAVRALLDHREFATLGKTFGASYLKHVHPITGRIHTSFFPYTGAGRYASRAPNLQQLPRHSVFRHCFRPKPGYVFVIVDYSQVEIRVMAELAADRMLIDCYRRGIDVHRQTAAIINNVSIDEVSSKDPRRQAAKPCIAAGQLVLTNHGLKAIELVAITDLVWDGVSWVAHEGVVYKGYQEVITYGGLTATPDHRVYLDDGRIVSFREAAAGQRCLAVGGDGAVPVRYLGADGAVSADGGKERAACGGGVQRVQEDLAPVPFQRAAEEDDRVYVPAQGQVRQRPESYDIGGALRCDVAALSGAGQRAVQELWCPGDLAEVREPGALHPLDARTLPSSYIQRGADRPGGQRRALRAWQSEAGYTEGEPAQQANQSLGGLLWQEGGAGGCVHRDQEGLPLLHPGAGDCGTEAQPQDRPADPDRCLTTGDGTATDDSEPTRRYAHVYDITNAGPLHRFTVSDHTVVNCNFGLLYGLMPPKLRLYSLALYGVVMSPQQAELFHKRYFENYVGVKKWQENALREGKARSYTRTLGGRIRYLHPTKDHNAYLCSPDQGSAADMLKRSLPLVLRRLQERFGDEAQMVHMVHDEIIVECPDTPDAKKQVLETVIQAMEEGGQYYLKKVPLVAEGKAGYSWAEK